jgi:hypothetical protein
MQHSEFTLHLKAKQEKRIADYVALHQRLDSDDYFESRRFRMDYLLTDTMSRELDELAIEIQKHDRRGRTVGEILGWDTKETTS